MDDRSAKDHPDRISCPCAKERLSRRGFLKAAGGTTLAAATLAGPVASALAEAEEGGDMGQGGITGFFKSLLGICETAKLGPKLWSLEGSMVRVKVGDVPELQNNGGAVYLEGRGLDTPVLVLREGEGEYLAFSNRCTHMGRKVDPVPGKGVLRCCSVSHAVYDYQGKVLDGPAKGPLTVYPTALEKGQLVVTLKNA